MTFLALILGTLSTAQAIPQQFTHQGRMMDADGVGLDGAFDLDFILMDSEFSGSDIWSEGQVVIFKNGYYSVVLGTDGSNNPLDSEILPYGWSFAWTATS